jgi:hypothetical protein
MISRVAMRNRLLPCLPVFKGKETVCERTSTLLKYLAVSVGG